MSNAQDVQPLSGDPTRVLIVEDEGLVALYLEDTLDALGYQCCGIAHSAERAFEIAEAERPAIALVDIGLRGSRDGIALSGELRARFDISVVFLSGATDWETRRRAEAVRPHGFLGKPCSEDAIAAALQSALRPLPSG